VQKHDPDRLIASPPRARTSRPAAESTLAPGPASILRLQRLAGNASVTSLMVSRKPQTAAVPVADPVMDSTQLTRSDLMFTPLPPGRGWLVGAGRNHRAHELQVEFGHVFETYNQADGILGFLQYAEQKMGPRELAAIEAIGPTVAKKSVGDAGASMRTAVEQYTQANPSLVAAFSEVRAGQSELVAKFEFFRKAVSEKDLTGGKREETKAEEGVKEVQEKIDKAKKWADEILDGTFKLLSGEWKDALKDIGKFAIKELILDPIAEGAYEEDLNKAKKTLSDAKAKVASLEDERDLHALQGATNELRAAKDTLEAKINVLLVAARKANAAHRTLVEKLSGMGRAGAAAAEALESRQEVADQAKLGNDVLAKYQAQVEKAGGHAHLLAVSYQIYADFAASPGGENEVPNKDILARIGMDARQNQWTSEHLEKWSKDEVGRIGEAQTYIASGSYMKSYRDIDESLAGAVANR
jgi:hypothetical protein